MHSTYILMHKSQNFEQISGLKVEWLTYMQDINFFCQLTSYALDNVVISKI